MVANNFSQKGFGTMLVALLLAGCSALATTPIPTTDTPTPISPTSTSIPPTDTPSPVPPTATSTPLPPTDTPTAVPPTHTPTAIPPTKTPSVFILATSIKDIVGTWYNPILKIYLRFYEDGFLHQSHSLERLDTSPYAKCEVWFEGTQMFLKQKQVIGVPSCGDAIGIYEIRLYPEGNIQIVTIEDSCFARSGDTALKLDPVP